MVVQILYLFKTRGPIQGAYSAAVGKQKIGMLRNMPKDMYLSTSVELCPTECPVSPWPTIGCQCGSPQQRKHSGCGFAPPARRAKLRSPLRRHAAAFSAGANLLNPRSVPRPWSEKTVNALCEQSVRLFALNKPLVAAVHGAASPLSFGFPFN